jgi:hypothetical protein
MLSSLVVNKDMSSESKFIENSSSWQAHSSSPSHYLRLSLNAWFHNTVHNKLFSVFSHTNPIHNLPFQRAKFRFSIILAIDT